MAKSSWPTVIASVFKSEGGYVNHPADPGGATNFGITAATLGSHRRLGRHAKPVEVRNLTRREAGEIYRARYWNRVNGDHLPAGIDLATMDGAVNSGVPRGAKWLQRAVGVPADGAVGPQTIAAADAVPSSRTIERMLEDREVFLRRLRHWSTFGRGWMRRLRRVRAEALELARKNPALDRTAVGTGAIAVAERPAAEAVERAPFLPGWLGLVLVVAALAYLAWRHRAWLIERWARSGDLRNDIAEAWGDTADHASTLIGRLADFPNAFAAVRRAMADAMRQAADIADPDDEELTT